MTQSPLSRRAAAVDYYRMRDNPQKTLRYSTSIVSHPPNEAKRMFETKQLAPQIVQ